MMKQVSNPFRPSKFEFEFRPLIWVSPRARRMFRDAGSFFVLGARGSGKTSLLKTLDTNELINNKSLQHQIPLSQLPCLGVYIRAPDLFTQVANGIDWSAFSGGSLASKELTEAAYLSYLIETAAVEILLRTLVKLRINGHASYKARSADDAVKKFLTAPEATFLNSHIDHYSIETGDSIEALANAIELARSKVNQALIRGDWPDFSRQLEIAKPGALVARSADTFFNLTRGGTFVAPEKLRLKILLDECDYFTEFQQTVVNTMVRNTKFPIEWIVAFVPGEREVTATLSPTFGLTASDRNVIDLDVEKDSFEDFCQHVCSHRIHHLLRQLEPKTPTKIDPKTAFNLKKRLGSYRLNEMIFAIGTEGNNKAWSKIEADAMELSAQIELHRQHRTIKKDDFKESDLGGERHHFWQAYLIKKLQLNFEQAVFDKRTRAVFQSTLRRKQRAAYLHIAADLKKSGAQLFGYSVIISLADNCIRDFLDIMAAIFDEYLKEGGAGKVIGFCRSGTAIDPQIQKRATVNAGEQKYLGFQQRIGGRSRRLTRLIDGLGFLTHLLQVEYETGLTGTAERGIFVLPSDRMHPTLNDSLIDYEAIESTLKLAQQENLLVFNPSRKGSHEGLVSNPEDGGFQFRLHRRFAAKYNFSYRGALERVHLLPAMLSQLLTSGDELGVLQWARDVAISVGADDSQAAKQLDLFRERPHE